jgi:hypothetical protein
MRNDLTNPFQNTATARPIADRIRDLAHRKTQAEIASEAGFPDIGASAVTTGASGQDQKWGTGNCQPFPGIRESSKMQDPCT